MQKSDIPKTGQTKCYDVAGKEIPVAGTGQDGETLLGVAWPQPRFTVNSGAEADSVTDNLAGLIWAKNADLPGGTKTWQEALDFVARLNSGPGLCGHTDWRLPNLNELDSLLDASTFKPSLPPDHPFLNVQALYYWTSTSFASHPGDAWMVYVVDGNMSLGHKTDGYYVWPVRSGQ